MIKGEKMKWINFDIDDKTHADFKALCASKNITMQKQVENMIREFIKRR